MSSAHHLDPLYSQRPHRPVGSSALRAVVIEDEPEIRTAHRRMLEQVGLETVVTTNASDGVEAVRAFLPVVTVLDVTMPGMDGLAAARRIREFSDTHIIMVSGLGGELDVVQGLNAGADDYLLKPVRAHEFRARVEAVLRRNRTTVQHAEPEGEPGLWTAEEWLTPAAVTLPPHRVSSPPPARTTPLSVVTTVDDATARLPQVSDSEVAPEPAAPTIAPPRAQPATPPTTQPTTPSMAEVPEHGWLSTHGLAVHPASGTVRVGDEDVVLTRDELTLLTSLLGSGTRVRSTANLVLALRDEGYVTTYFVNDADKRVIRETMESLRRKVGDTGSTPTWIESVQGVGYRMVSAVIS